jgi:hypothetical protein
MFRALPAATASSQLMLATQLMREPPAAHGLGTTREERPSVIALSSTAARPIRQVLQAVDDSRGLQPLFSLLARSRLCWRARAVWQCRPAPTLSGLLPAAPPTRGLACPQLRPVAATTGGGPLNCTEHQRLAAHSRARPRPGWRGRCRCVAAEPRAHRSEGLQHVSVLALRRHSSRLRPEVGERSFPTDCSRDRGFSGCQSQASG